MIKHDNNNSDPAHCRGGDRDVAVIDAVADTDGSDGGVYIQSSCCRAKLVLVVFLLLVDALVVVDHKQLGDGADDGMFFADIHNASRPTVHDVPTLAYSKDHLHPPEPSVSPDDGQGQSRQSLHVFHHCDAVVQQVELLVQSWEQPVLYMVAKRFCDKTPYIHGHRR